MLTLKVGHHYITYSGHPFTVLSYDPRMANTTSAFLCSDQRTRSREGKWVDGPATTSLDASVEITISPGISYNLPASQQHTDLCNVLWAIISGLPPSDAQVLARENLKRYEHEHLPPRS